MLGRKSENKKIVVIAPHPDDEMLGCGGTIIKAIKKGYNVNVVYLTSGDSNQKLRENEARKVCRFLGVSKSFFLRLHKTGLNPSLTSIKKITDIFERVRPDIVYINHDKDGDREHQISYHLTSEAVWRYNMKASKPKRINTVLLYEIHRPMQNYSLVEDISSVIKKKMLAMAIYKSQLKSVKIDSAIRGLNRYRGSMHEGVDFAEVFQVKRMVSLFS